MADKITTGPDDYAVDDAAAAAEAAAVAAEAAASDAVEDADDDEDNPEGADKLGDAGKRALDSMKAKLKAERDKRKTAEAERDTLRNGATKDGEPTAEQIRADAQKAADSKANGRIVRAEIRALAAGKLADPKDALVHLDVSKFEVDDEGEVDSEEIADAIAELLKEKPYLAAATAKRFQGTGDGGAARKAGGVKQVTEAELKTMKPEQIVKAQAEGRLTDLLGAG